MWHQQYTMRNHESWLGKQASGTATAHRHKGLARDLKAKTKPAAGS